MVLLRMSIYNSCRNTFGLLALSVGAVVYGRFGPSDHWQRKPALVIGMLLLLFTVVLGTHLLKTRCGLVLYSDGRVWTSGPLRLGYKQLDVRPGGDIRIKSAPVGKRTTEVVVESDTGRFRFVVGTSALSRQDQLRLPSGISVMASDASRS